MDLGGIIPQVFRMQIVIKSDPSIPIQKLRDRLHTAFYEDDTFARVARPFMDRREPNALCDASGVIPMDTRHLTATCAPKGFLRAKSERQKTAKGPHAAY
ncbi:mitochondrial processing peptide beta subunit [Trypanosoma cruzi]|nr:mitochondrial processing peptide beta subunit [Trypanosoma cruzi]